MTSRRTPFALPSLLTLLVLLGGLLVPVGTALAAPAGEAAPTAHSAAKPRSATNAKNTKTSKVWPRGRIRYVDRTQDPEAVRLATRIWNTSGLGVRFIEVRKPGSARLVLRDVPTLASGCGTGRAGVGYPGRTGTALVEVRSGADSAGQRCATPGQTLTLVRLLGRVLGLKDSNARCSAMNSVQVGGVAPARCLTPGAGDGDDAPGRWLCSPLTAADLARARRMYGGSPRPLPADPWCSLVAPMPAAGSITVRDVGDGELVASLQRLAEPGLPAYLGKDASEPEWELHQTAGTCTAQPGSDDTLEDADTWEVPVGGLQEVDLFPVATGAVCFTLFARDLLGRYALASSSVVVDVPAPAA
jgi:hypothetical protein